MHRDIRSVSGCLVLGMFCVTWSATWGAVSLASASEHLNSRACPLCPAIGAQTIGESLTSMDVAAFVVLAEKREDPAENQTNARFEIIDVLFGGEVLGGTVSLELDYYGAREVGTEFLLAAIDPLNLTWNDPVLMSARAREYVTEVTQLPQQQIERLKFFYSKLEDPDQVIASDAYDEFARASYADVLALTEHYEREQLLEWTRSEDVPPIRKRLYFMLLGICGTEDEVPELRELLELGLQEKQSGMDSMIACFLSLAGETGMDFIDERFLKDDSAGYGQTYSAIMALRFHGTDADTIPRERVVQSFRHLLDRPAMADLIIPDLARWEDWDSAARLMELYRDVAPENQFVRVPIVIYMRLCPDPAAREYLVEMKEIDPGAITKADLAYAFGN